ncbi:MAG TPA: nuclear transport factor 2 family protein [Candidatus Binatia bacterium]|nr:nuclear transport factor 2 family protein [Candidatus Binatia bacterium]
MASFLSSSTCAALRRTLPAALALLFLGTAPLGAEDSGASWPTPTGNLPVVASRQPQTAADNTAGVRRVLDDQQAAWNRGDLEGFAQGYWRSDATAFAGTQGILRGWQALLERYRRSYPDRKAMGTLTFSNLEVTPLCADAALALGHWHLDREAGPIGGVFSLVLRRFPEGWRVIADHTSVVPAPAARPGL